MVDSVVFVADNVPVSLKLPPTFKFFAIPTPPVTITAPVVGVVESVVFVNVAVPTSPKLPPTFKFFTMPTPPATTNAPVVGVVDSVVFVENIIPARVDVPVTPRLPPTFKFFAMPAPPATINAPLVGAVDCVVLVAINALVENAPPTNKFPPMLAPPVPEITNAPVPRALAGEFEVNVTPLENEDAPWTVKVVTVAAAGVTVPSGPFIEVATRLFIVAVPVTPKVVNVAGAEPNGPTVRQDGPLLGPTYPSKLSVSLL